MKVNLIVNEQGSKEGYENVPLNDQGMSSIPDSACKELMVDNVLEFMDKSSVDIVLKKLRKHGVLEIRSPEAEEICRQLQIGSIGLDEASSLLSQGRMRMTTLGETKSFLESQGMEIQFAGINGPFYRITARRP